MAITVENIDSLIEDDVAPVTDAISTIFGYKHPAGCSLLAVEISIIGGGAVSRVIYNGSGLDVAVQATNTDRECSIWYVQLSDETIGDIEIVTSGDTYGRKVGVCSMAGTILAGSPINTTATYNTDVSEGNGLDITPTIDGCLIFDGVVCGDSSSVAGAETVIYADDNGTYLGGMLGGCQYFIQTTAATKTMSWSWSGESPAVHTLVAFLPEPEPSTNTNQFFLFFN